ILPTLAVQPWSPGPPPMPTSFWAPWAMTTSPTVKRMRSRERDRSICLTPPVEQAPRIIRAKSVGVRNLYFDLTSARSVGSSRTTTGPAASIVRGAPLADAITPDMTIASVTERWPDTARIFARYGLGCASCAISKSETVLQGATGHGGGRVNVEELLRDLNTFASTGKLPTGLPEASAVASGGGMKVKGMAEQKGIKQVIAVMSGKGGVGKSLVAGLLAVGLKRRGFTVGVLDGDITGPSIPRMFGVREKPGVAGPNTLKPSVSRGGIPIMSMNLLLPGEEEAVIWRGPMVS